LKKKLGHVVPKDRLGVTSVQFIRTHQQASSVTGLLLLKHRPTAELFTKRKWSKR